MVKKRHTNKELIISTPGRWIGYVSRTYEGKAHDYSLLQAEFDPQQNWFEPFEVRLDLGFQGFADLYPCKKVYIPHKKKRRAKGQCNELTAQQKEANKAQAKQRIYVEHSIGGMKRYLILVHRMRLKKHDIINRAIGVCAGLWNFKCNRQDFI